MRNIHINNGVCLHIENTNKFKDVTVSIRFLTNLTKESATIRSLLGNLLVDRSAKYDTKQKMQNKLDLLYGANLYHKVTGYGKGHVLEIKSQVLNERYTKESLLEEQFALLSEVLFHPLLNETTFVEAKKLLKEKFDRHFENPSSYASKKLLEYGASRDPLAIYAPGDADYIAKITLDDVICEHQQLLSNNKVDVFVIGDVNEEEVIELCNKYLPLTSVNAYDSYYVMSEQEFSRGVEKKDIQQSILSMLYRTQTNIQSSDYWTLRVVNGMFGAFPISYLFQEVREKRSLCYSIYSTIIAYDGALVVQTGMDKENVELAEELIHSQLVRLQSNDFSDELLMITKEMLKNGLLTIEDSVSSLIGLGYQSVLLDKEQTLQYFIDQIEQVTREDIVRVSNILQLQYTFVLEQEETNEEIL